MGCNYLSLPFIPASDTTFLIWYMAPHWCSMRVLSLGWANLELRVFVGLWHSMYTMCFINLVQLFWQFRCISHSKHGLLVTRSFFHVSPCIRGLWHRVRWWTQNLLMITVCSTCMCFADLDELCPIVFVGGSMERHRVSYHRGQM